MLSQIMSVIEKCHSDRVDLNTFYEKAFGFRKVAGYHGSDSDDINLNFFNDPSNNKTGTKITRNPYTSDFKTSFAKLLTSFAEWRKSDYTGRISKPSRMMPLSFDDYGMEMHTTA